MADILRYLGKKTIGFSRPCEQGYGQIIWYDLVNQMHRVDAPAVVWSDGSLWWCLHGNSYNFDDWLKRNFYLTDEEKTLLKLEYG